MTRGPGGRPGDGFGRPLGREFPQPQVCRHTGRVTDPSINRDRDATRRPRNARPRDGLGRPLAYGSEGVERAPEGTVRTPTNTLAEAHRLFAAGMPFHAHEVLEDAWKAAPPGERELWRGLAQLAVGATHAARGNRSGAVALLDRGRAAVLAYRGTDPHGLDVDAIAAWVGAAVASIDAQVPVNLPPPPLVA